MVVGRSQIQRLAILPHTEPVRDVSALASCLSDDDDDDEWFQQCKKACGCIKLDFGDVRSEVVEFKRR